MGTHSQKSQEKVIANGRKFQRTQDINNGKYLLDKSSENDVVQMNAVINVKTDVRSFQQQMLCIWEHLLPDTFKHTERFFESLSSPPEV